MEGTSSTTERSFLNQQLFDLLVAHTDLLRQTQGWLLAGAPGRSSNTKLLAQNGNTLSHLSLKAIANIDFLFHIIRFLLERNHVLLFLVEFFSLTGFIFKLVNRFTIELSSEGVSPLEQLDNFCLQVLTHLAESRRCVLMPLSLLCNLLNALQPASLFNPSHDFFVGRSLLRSLLCSCMEVILEIFR